AINEAFDKLFQEIKTKETDKGVALFSKPEPEVDSDVVELWQQLAMSEEIHQQPKSRAKNIRDIAAEIDSGIVVDQLDVPMHKHGNTVKEWKLTMPDGKSGYMRENNDGTLELNAVSLVSGQSRGNALYNVVATYAHNNGKVFIGDREGLSDMAVYRRTENMMSSALKFGTTKHLRPHPKQKIDWIQGDDKGNLVRLIQRHYANITEYFPNIKAIRYDFGQKEFINTGDGAVFTEDDFRATAGVTRGEGTPQAGATTLKRAVVTNTLVQGTGKEMRSRLLGQIVRQLRTKLDPALEKILYSKDSLNTQNPANAGFSVSEVEKIIAPVILTWGDNAPTVEVVQSVKNVPEFIVDADDHPGGFEAVYYSPEGKIYLVADMLPTEERTLKVLAHEAVGHHSFEELMGDDLDIVLERIQWLKRGDDKKIVDIANEVKRRYGRLDKATEAREIVAVMAERGIRHPVVARVAAAIKKFLRKLGISLKWSATELEALIVQAGKRLEKHGAEKGNKKTTSDYNHNSKMFSRPEPEIRDDIDQIVKDTPTYKEWIAKAKAKTLDDTRTTWLTALTRMHLADVGKDVLPQINTYVKRAQQMEADRNHMIIEAAEIAKPWTEWARSNREEAMQLADLMHDATIAGADPAVNYSPLVTEEEYINKVKVLKQHARDSSGEAYKYIYQLKELDALRGFELNRKKA
ncbi:MAG: hypothetical protein OEY89_18560, partial [Gammaproteobacteria bacterium]|nr:hypothetical protein [Gammaproteobacteria bacterium]